MAVACGLALASAGGAAAQRFEVPPDPGSRWFKGNTHTHTLESDGDSPPEVVARWYKGNGYNFLVLSDHNVWVDPETLAMLMDSSFLLIPGEEVTSAFERKPVHINGLNIPHVIEPRTDSTLVGTIQKNVDAVRAVEGVPHINHPNFGWAFDHHTLAQVRNDRLLEIFNGHPLVHNAGGGDAPGLEEIWDHLLTGGKRIYGIAVDDAHHFVGEFSRDRANPGRGWVVVRADRLDAEEILGRLEAGEFYATTGVELEDIDVTATRLEIRIRQQQDFRYTTEFIGNGGRVLERTGANPAVYVLRAADGLDGYVRARVTDSGGAVAWVQPVFIRRQ
ncbi:MAG: CehA/McbA family metallohydrolase [Longimicrobiales bacterium]